MPRRTRCILFLVFFLSGCSASATVTTSPTVAVTQPSMTAVAPGTDTPFPTQTQTPLPTGTPTASQTPALVSQSCSPLAGIRLDQLPQLMTGDVFDPPAPGREDGHHGIDFAFYRFGDLTSMLGLPVQAVLPGQVAAVINNEKPYGNAIIIETPLKDISFAWQATINLPAQSPTVQPDQRLTCPAPPVEAWMPSSQRSIYHLYAHLNRLPALKIGDAVECGQAIGEVGTTGNSVNPHLHLETRVGPEGATFTGLGHYDTRISEEDRSNYCIWRVSGWFEMFDPMAILFQNP